MNATKQIENAKSPLEKKNLDEKLGQQFKIKKEAFAREQTEKWEDIQNDIFACIKDLSKEKKLEMVFNKSAGILLFTFEKSLIFSLSTPMRAETFSSSNFLFSSKCTMELWKETSSTATVSKLPTNSPLAIP